MLRKSKKKFAVVTSAEHFKHYEPLMPEGTRYLVEDNPDIRRFLQDGIPLGTDVAVVDEAGFCAQGDSQNRADLVAFLQDLADAGASMQIVVVASEKREKGDPWIAELYSRGIYDVIDPMRSYDLDATIERAVRHPAAAEDVEGGYRADEPGGMAAILAARKAKKERKRAAKAARGAAAPEDGPKSISEQMGASSGESEGPRPLLDGPSETQLARERLHDSGKLPRIAEAEAGVYEVVDEEPAPAAEPRPGGQAPQEAPLPEPEDPRSQDGSGGAGPEGAGAMMAPGQAALLELVREEVAREQEQREERMRREYEQREERMRREYEQRIGEAMRSGRRQRVVAVAGAAPSAMTAETALEAAAYAAEACPGCRAAMFEHVGDRLPALEAAGAEAAGPREAYPDVAVHDLGPDLAALAALDADISLVVIDPAPWAAERQAAAIAEAGVAFCGGTYACVPARGPLARPIARAAGAGDAAPLSVPNPNHFAYERPRPADGLEEALGPMMAELASEMGAEAQPVAQRRRAKRREGDGAAPPAREPQKEADASERIDEPERRFERESARKAPAPDEPARGDGDGTPGDGQDGPAPGKRSQDGSAGADGERSQRGPAAGPPSLDDALRTPSDGGEG